MGDDAWPDQLARLRRLATSADLDDEDRLAILAAIDRIIRLEARIILRHGPKGGTNV